MSSRGLPQAVVFAVGAAALMGAAVVAQYYPAVGLPLAIAVSAAALWLLLRYGAEL